MDLSQESFILPLSDAVYRYPTFVFRNPTLLRIFVKFVTIDLVTRTAKDLDPEEDLTSDNGDNISLSLPLIYKVLATLIRINGEQHMPSGVKKAVVHCDISFTGMQQTLLLSFHIFLLGNPFYRSLDDTFLV